MPASAVRKPLTILLVGGMLWSVGCQNPESGSASSVESHLESGLYLRTTRGFDTIEPVISADAVEGSFGAIIQYYSPDTFAKHATEVAPDFELLLVPDYRLGPPRSLGTLMQLAPVSAQVLGGQFHDPEVRGKTWMYGKGESRQYGGFVIRSEKTGKGDIATPVIHISIRDCDAGSWLLQDYATQRVYFLQVR